MSQRINISISDTLYKRLEGVRGKINVSQLCQKAIADEIEKREAFEKRINESPEMNEILNRLRKEKMETRGEVEKLAILDGIEWAKIAHYDDLFEAAQPTAYSCKGPDGILGRDLHDYLVEKAELEPMDDVEFDEDTPNAIKDALPNRLFEYINKMKPELNINYKNETDVELIYYESFYKGVAKFWNEIKEII